MIENIKQKGEMLREDDVSVNGCSPSKKGGGLTWG